MAYLLLVELLVERWAPQFLHCYELLIYCTASDLFTLPVP